MNWVQTWRIHTHTRARARAQKAGEKIYLYDTDTMRESHM